MRRNAVARDEGGGDDNERLWLAHAAIARLTGSGGKRLQQVRRKGEMARKGAGRDCVGRGEEHRYTLLEP